MGSVGVASDGALRNASAAHVGKTSELDETFDASLHGEASDNFFLLGSAGHSNRRGQENLSPDASGQTPLDAKPKDEHTWLPLKILLSPCSCSLPASDRASASGCELRRYGRVGQDHPEIEGPSSC